MTDEVKRWDVRDGAWVEQYKDKIYFCLNGYDADISENPKAVVVNAVERLEDDSINPVDKDFLQKLISAVNEARNRVAVYAAIQLARAEGSSDRSAIE